MVLYLDNIVYSLQKAGGISVYWYELSKRILLSHNRVFFIEEYQTDNIFRNLLSIPAGNLIRKSKRPISITRYLPVGFNQTKQDSLFHSSYYRTPADALVSSVVTVHDFTYEKMKQGVRKRIHQAQKKAALNAASGIICISENTKHDMLALYPHLAQKKITVIYNGVSDSFFPINKNNYLPPPEENDIKELITTDYIIFIGSREAYKNFSFAVDVTSNLHNHTLIIIGGEITKEEGTLLQTKLKQRWKHFTGISNHKLNTLYNFARFLLYPSSYEGFGIPVIEAEKAGCPVIALHASSIPEITGNPELLLQTLQTEECLQKIEKIDNNHDSIIAKGIENSKKYSWDKCYTEVIEFYTEILNC